MSLSALPTMLAIPPINCLVAACAGVATRRYRAGRILAAMGLGGLLLFSVPVVSGCLIYSLEAGLHAAPGAAAEKPQAIVILSADLARIWTGDAIGWRVGAMTLQREAAGSALARLTHLPVLVSGGSLRDGAPSLASTMALSLDRDFATSVTWQEDASKDTWQNAMFSAAILRRHGISRVYVVTHAWHMRRSLAAFRAAGLYAVAAPVQIDAEPDLRASNFVPSVHGWQQSYYALHELIGWAWYAIRS